MPPSKSYAYVASFVHEGLLAQDAGDGPLRPRAVCNVARRCRVASIRPGRGVARRENSAALSESTTCSVLLTTWGNRGPAIVHRVDGKRRGPTSVRVGYVLPLWRSAAGRAFSLILPARDDGGAVSGRRTAAPTPPRSMPRSRGFARPVLRLRVRATSSPGIAAPVLDHDGNLVAALTLSRPYDDNTHERRLVLGAIARTAAASISKQLGHATQAASAPANVKGSHRALGKRNAVNRV